LMGLTTLGVLMALTVAVEGGQDPGLERLYGRVITDEGLVIEGFIRWDRNEASWTDYLDGHKQIPLEFIREAEALDPDFAAEQRSARSIIAFGTRITWDEDDESDPFTSVSGIRFGHVASLITIDNRTAVLELKGGGRVELKSSSTDIGNRMRGVEVDVPGSELVRVRWVRLERIDFMAVPDGVRPEKGDRLFGTVTTWGDLELTGHVSWDLDEILSTDILDGREGREDHEIPFADIESIDWESSRSALVTLRTGDQLELRGTNDVNRDNRGIEVSDVGFGRAIVPWEDFKSVRFHEPEAEPDWPVMGAATPLRGTVYARDGRTIEGEIRWDNDEDRRWETLDGWSGDTDFDIEFGAIASITKLDEDRVSVTLFDGRTLELEGADDVDRDNRGVFVKPEGRARRLVRWIDFDRVVFTR
jgi:hypothetical protein